MSHSSVTYFQTDKKFSSKMSLEKQVSAVMDITIRAVCSKQHKIMHPAEGFHSNSFCF